MMIDLRSRYGCPGKPVVTAHRGFSGQYPENTLLAFQKAVEHGVDIVEFDVRESFDGELVIIHDSLLDRTTNGSGPVSSQSLADLKRLNATYWRGPHNTGMRMPVPIGSETVPTLEEALQSLAGKVGLNIQIKAVGPSALDRVIDRYLDYELQDSGFLMLRSFADGKRIRATCPDVAICIGEERENLDRHLSFGVDYVQPTRHCLTPSYVRRLKESKIPANFFYANEPDEMNTLIEQGLPGIMTDVPDVLISTIALRSGISTEKGGIVPQERR